MLERHGNHPCWQWQHADVGEYLSISDLHALVAPRPLVVETGKIDETFSYFVIPFAADKQVAERSRGLPEDAHRFVHYLHYDQHHFHVGDLDPVVAVERNLRAPVEVGSLRFNYRYADWQLDPEHRGRLRYPLHVPVGRRGPRGRPP